jgi:hypothetical protein
MRANYWMIFASLITVTLANIAWCQENNKSRPSLENKVDPAQADAGEPSECAEFQKWSMKWRECMKASVPCFAMHGSAYEVCCETERDSPACKAR